MKSFFKVGIIRVVTLDDQELLNLHGKMIEQRFPGIITETKCIPDQPEGIHSEEQKQIAVPKIVALAKSFKDVNMLIVSCADDPGVQEIRDTNPGIPVTGAGESSAAIASIYGNRIALLGITGYAPEPYIRMIPNKILTVGKPDGVNSTLDLMTKTGRENAVKKGLEQKEMGAQVILLTCTGMSTIGIASELEEITGLPVIDPVLAEGMFAYHASIR